MNKYVKTGGVLLICVCAVSILWTSSHHKKDVLIFAVIGIVIAFGYVLILNMLDTTIKSAQDIEKISGVTVLASIPIYDLAETKSKGRRGGKR